MSAIMQTVGDALLHGTLLTTGAAAALPMSVRSDVITSQAFIPGVAPKIRELCAGITSGKSLGLDVVAGSLVVHVAIVFLVALVAGLLLEDVTDIKHSIFLTATLCLCAAVAGVLVATSTSDTDWRVAVGRTLTDLAVLLPLVLIGIHTGTQLRAPSAHNIHNIKALTGQWLMVSAIIVLSQVLVVSIS